MLAAAQVASRLELLVLSGAAEGETLRIEEASTIGSGEAAEVRLEASGGVAALHATIERYGSGFWLRSLGGSECECAVRVQADGRLHGALHLRQRLLREREDGGGAVGQRRLLQQLQPVPAPPTAAWRHLAVAVWVRSKGRQSFVSLPPLKPGKRYHVGRGAANAVTLADMKAKKKQGSLVRQVRVACGAVCGAACGACVTCVRRV